jgi:hypothetical protein
MAVFRDAGDISRVAPSLHPVRVDEPSAMDVRRQPVADEQNARPSRHFIAYFVQTTIAPQATPGTTN